MYTHRIVYVDVFTDRPLFGNPVAVVFDADDLDEATMRRVAAFTNLSETVFVLAPGEDADYRVRIFTPRSELPFAGHPTIGACHAIRASNATLSAKAELVQACAAGLIPLRIEGERAFARVPRPRMLAEPIDHAALALALGTNDAADAVVIDCGPRWLTASLPSLDALYALAPDERALTALSRAQRLTGVTVYALDGATPHVRSFAPADGIPEDPVCGSGNACVGAHLRTTGRASTTGSSYTARQGRAVGRDGFVSVRLEGDDVLVGGSSVVVLEGSLTLE